MVSVWARVKVNLGRYGDVEDYLVSVTLKSFIRHTAVTNGAGMKKDALVGPGNLMRVAEAKAVASSAMVRIRLAQAYTKHSVHPPIIPPAPFCL